MLSLNRYDLLHVLRECTVSQTGAVQSLVCALVGCMDACVWLAWVSVEGVWSNLERAELVLHFFVDIP